ncbi:MAG: GEVED domain-containing protein [Candidatus Eisenbacteria bacterium]
MKIHWPLAVIAVAVLSISASAEPNVVRFNKWAQQPDLDPTGIDVNASTSPEGKFVLGDDFLCTETSAITDIYVWGSWYLDMLPQGDPRAVLFTLAICSDVPDSLSPTGYSMPGDPLWSRVFDGTGNDVSVRMWSDGLQEGWMTPPAAYDPIGDTVCWQYSFETPEAEAFVQQGSPESPVVYWLILQAIPFDANALFGWKTSLDHWNDDAVWGTTPNFPDVGWWDELRYPAGHPMVPESIDLAFAIGDDIGTADWGDAPDPTYPTLAASNGAAHVITPGLLLGQAIDAEDDGQPSPHAGGDNVAGLWDEDGVLFSYPIGAGDWATVQVDLSNSGPGFLDAWIDFGRDGSWAEATDQVFASLLLAGGTVHWLNYLVPESADDGLSFARFRLSSQGGLSYDGAAIDGEVEDYEILIGNSDAWKWLQPPDLDDTGFDVGACDTFIVADDFLCDVPGWITEVHVWSSWLWDFLPWGADPSAVDFTLSIHEDVPADSSGTGYSMPGDVLWFREFTQFEFGYDIWWAGLSEGWLWPPDTYWLDADSMCWLYSFLIPMEEAFYQTGTPDAPVVYWLDIKARPHDEDASWGWKTSFTHWNDDAVWTQGSEPYHGMWYELRYPLEHVYGGESVDLAFWLRAEFETGVPDESSSAGYRLGQNTPNPFNPTTTISYDVPADGGHVEIRIIDVTGRLVRTLVDEPQTGGRKSVAWDGRDDGGERCGSGVYFYRIDAPGFSSSRKMVLLK